MIFDYLKRPLAFITAASLILGSASLQAFAAENNADVLTQESVVDTLTPDANPATSINVVTDEGVTVNDHTSLYVDKNCTVEYTVSFGNADEVDDSLVLSTSSKNISAILNNVNGNPNVAKLSITGKKAGTYTINLASGSGCANRKFNITVLEPVSDIKIKNGENDVTGNGVLMYENHQTQFLASNTPSSTTDTIRWSVDNTNLAEISQDGLLTAKANGTVTVTATAVNSLLENAKENESGQKNWSGLNERNVIATTKVTIAKANPITELSFPFKELNLNISDVYDAGPKLSMTKRDEANSSSDEIVWKSSDTSVVSVNKTTGLLTASGKKGTVTITASTNNIEPVRASFVVNVSSPVDSMSFSNDKYVFEVGSEGYIIVNELPISANELLVWQLEKEGIVEIVEVIDDIESNQQKIKIKAVAEGNTKIIASTDRVATVNNPNPTNVSVTGEIIVVASLTDSRNYKIQNELKDVVYNGLFQEQKPVVTDLVGNILEEGKDYTVTFSSAVNVGTVTVTINGVNSKGYYGETVLTYQITPMDISDVNRSAIADKSYNYGTPVTVSSIGLLKRGDVNLVEDKDFDIYYDNNINAGEAIITFFGKGNYRGSTEIRFNILPKDISSAKIGDVASEVYTGDEIIPELTVTQSKGKVTLEENVDYTVEFIDNVSVGKVAAVLTGIGNYTGTLKKSEVFSITKKSVTEDNQVYIEDIPNQSFMGGMPVCPDINVYFNNFLLIEGIDYTVSYSDNTKPDENTMVTVNFNESANFSGKLTKNFNIVNYDVVNPANTVKAFDEEGNEIANDAIIYLDTETSCYFVISIEHEGESCDDVLLVAMDASTTNATVKFTGFSRDGKTGIIKVTGVKPGSFTVTVTTLSGTANKKLNFTIKKPATKIDIYEGKENITSSGLLIAENHQTKLTAKLSPTNTTDSVEWSVDKTNLAEISQDGVLTAKKYGTVIVTAKIKPCENLPRSLYISTTVTISKANPIQELSFPFKSINLNVKNEYDAASKLNKSILDSKNSSTDRIIWSSSDTSVVKVDSVTGKLTAQSKKGTATITATTDSLTPVSASFDVVVSTPVTSMAFSTASYSLLTGYESEIVVIQAPKTANEPIEWSVDDPSIVEIISSEYDPTSNVQTIKVKALKKGSCKITVKTVRIPTLTNPNPVQVEATCGVVVNDPILLKNTTISIGATKYAYTGKEIKPAVTVKYKNSALKEGTDYTVSYTSNKNIGTAKVTVTGVGKYVGSVSKTFSIVLGKVSGLKLYERTSSEITLKWSKNSFASGYIVEQYKGSKWTVVKKITSPSTTSYKATKLSASTSYKFRVKAYKTAGKTTVYSAYTSTLTATTAPKAVSGLKVGGVASNVLRINWTKNTSASGYILEQYKSNKWVRIAKITKNTTTSYRVTKLSASTTYKFRIKAYKTVGKAALYSDYSSTLTALTAPKAMSGVKVSAKTSSTITLKWNKNTSASGYCIELYKNGKWVQIKKVTSASTTSYKVTKLSKKMTYKFRIRAYKTSGKLVTYSGYSNVSGTTTK